MPDLIIRDRVESLLAEALGQIQSEIVTEILGVLGDPPDITKLTPELWTDWSTRYQSAIQPSLEKAFVASVETMVTETTVGIDWAQINMRAADWARNYTFNLVKGIEATNQAALRQAVSGFYEQRLTLGQLESKLLETFGPVRSEMISITETTRAAVEGEKAFIDEIRRMGAEMVGEVQTNEDERVCPICGGNGGKKVSEVGYPPFHPRCRCWVNWRPLLAK